MAERGTISINAENIMPVIKKWLYSDKDIFVRELVSTLRRGEQDEAPDFDGRGEPRARGGRSALAHRRG